MEVSGSEGQQRTPHDPILASSRIFRIPKNNIRAKNIYHQMVGNIDCTGILVSKRGYFTVDNIMYKDFHM